MKDLKLYILSALYVGSPFIIMILGLANADQLESLVRMNADIMLFVAYVIYYTYTQLKSAKN